MITAYIGDNNNLGFRIPITDIPMNVDDIEVLLKQKAGNTSVRQCTACQCPETGIIKCQGGRTETLFIDRGLLDNPKAIRRGVTFFVYDNGEEFYSVVFRVKPAEQIHPAFGVAVSAASLGGAVATHAAVGAASSIGIAVTAIPAMLFGLPVVPVLVAATGLGVGLVASGASIAKIVKVSQQVKAWKEARRGNAADVANVVGIGILTEQQLVAIFGNSMTKQQARWGWGTFVINNEMLGYFYFVSGRLSDSAKNALAQFSRYSPAKIIVHDLYEGKVLEMSDGKILPHNTITTKYELVHLVPDVGFDTSTSQNVPQEQSEQQNI